MAIIWEMYREGEGGRNDQNVEQSQIFWHSGARLQGHAVRERGWMYSPRHDPLICGSSQFLVQIQKQIQIEIWRILTFQVHWSLITDKYKYKHK